MPNIRKMDSRKRTLDEEENDEELSQENVRKRKHNLMEKKRRDKLTGSFSRLRGILPVFRKKENVRVSQIQILGEASNFIRKEKTPKEYLELEAIMEAENRYLENLSAELDKAKANNDVEAAMKLDPLGLLNEDTDSEDDEHSETGESSQEDGELESKIATIKRLALLLNEDTDSEEDGELKSKSAPLKRQLENEDTGSEDGESSEEDGELVSKRATLKHIDLLLNEDTDSEEDGEFKSKSVPLKRRQENEDAEEDGERSLSHPASPHRKVKRVRI